MRSLSVCPCALYEFVCYIDTSVVIGLEFFDSTCLDLRSLCLSAVWMRQGVCQTYFERLAAAVGMRRTECNQTNVTSHDYTRVGLLLSGMLDESPTGLWSVSAW